ncbi:hypothetical protein K469DRAFT_778980 [Zopfia rhizophila CBS 207.26]|uniref:Uncharacterized protein n=1 Tax=Zopfia rhizophila CBS 207.26 TaxID=1314779 RepID=A0A6A6E2G3_9PEZI|nr:hypothetical protein K469DRAFT_778980 [Zopfia rhizophila CBS 207.26]
MKSSIRAKIFKKSATLSGFERAGLHPYNPFIILQRLPQPRSCDPHTPSPVKVPKAPPTPHTARRTIIQAFKLSVRVKHNKPIHAHVLHKFLKGATAQRAAGAKAKEDLRDIFKAVNERQARQKPDRRVVQSGGTIYRFRGLGICS